MVANTRKVVVKFLLRSEQQMIKLQDILLHFCLGVTLEPFGII